MCEIQAALGLARPTFSKHLKILEDAGLLMKRKDGLWVNYRLPEKASSVFANTMLANIHDWFGDAPEIHQLQSLARAISRQNLCKISIKD